MHDDLALRPVAAAGTRHDDEPHTPMRELSLDDLDDLPYAGVALAQDTWGAARASRDASRAPWGLFDLLPGALAR